MQRVDGETFVEIQKNIICPRVRTNGWYDSRYRVKKVR